MAFARRPPTWCFHRRESLPFHANGMRLDRLDGAGAGAERGYYSVGGGFVVGDEVAADGQARGWRRRHHRLPHPFRSGAELLALSERG